MEGIYYYIALPMKIFGFPFKCLCFRYFKRQQILYAMNEMNTSL